MVDQVTLFSESQRLFPRLIAVAAVLLMGLMLWAVIQQIVLGEPWGNNPAPDAMLVVFAVVFGILFPAFLVSLRLRTTVVPGAVIYQFWPLHIHPRRLAVEEIVSVEALTFRPIRDSGGWGIRLGRHGWYYTAGGNRGVLIKRTHGRGMVIGSKRPEELAAAIERARG